MLAVVRVAFREIGGQRPPAARARRLHAERHLPAGSPRERVASREHDLAVGVRVARSVGGLVEELLSGRNVLGAIPVAVRARSRQQQGQRPGRWSSAPPRPPDTHRGRLADSGKTGGARRRRVGAPLRSHAQRIWRNSIKSCFCSGESDSGKKLPSSGGRAAGRFSGAKNGRMKRL